MYKKVSTDLNFVDRELEILEFWNQNKIFEKSISQRASSPAFTFYDGPPTANGKPHIGHVLTRVMKDIIPRYKTMKGYKVLRKAGWDTHGLPVELEVEKKLDMSGKLDIEKYGIEPFVQECKESVWKYETQWKEMSQRVGFWADMDNPYVTYHNSYIESVWWALKQIFDKGLLYKGHKIVPFCPRCETSLSSHEVAQGYKNVVDTSAYVKFKVAGKHNLYILAWTTTAWTLPSNVALAVNPEETYVNVKSGNDNYILAKSLVDNVLEAPYKIENEMPGKELIGMEYLQLFDFAEVDKKAFYVVADDFVTLTEGTGVVHIAPAFGEDDARVGLKNGLPFVQLVNEQGLFKDTVKPWQGMFVKDTDKLIIKNLEDRGLLLKWLDHEHSYPYCWRCDTSLLYYACDTWFIKMTAVKEKLINNNLQINWLPENIKEGRFGKFLENIVDWGLSRKRYWGTPLPIWECACGHIHAVGSIKELHELGIDVPEDIELHKPYIDKVLLRCPKCKTGKMRRVQEVIDCWFDAGSMPFAQWHYPFENQEIFKENFPSDFISEAIDQTRGWFYTLLAISTLLFDCPSYKNILVLGHVQDKNGQKMSKHKGNVVDPWIVLNKQGADAVRWYFYTSSAPWLPSRFYEEAISEVQRKFMRTLWNTYAFYVLYADLDSFDPKKYQLNIDKLSQIDKWILSKLNTLISSVTVDLEGYRITEAARAIQEFVDVLSNWYVRRNRENFWRSGMPQDKINSFMTLYTVLINIAKLLAPFTPFIAEEIYKNIETSSKAPESVHLCQYPIADLKMIDKELEDNMEHTLKLVALGRACRNAANIKNRQPLSKMYVCYDVILDETFQKIIKDELNVDDIDFNGDIKVFTTYTVKPQLKTLGPKYGKLVPKISEILRDMDGAKLLEQLNREPVVLCIGHTEVSITKSDILVDVNQLEGFISETGLNATVVLDTNLTSSLIERGIVREIISKIQTMRKEFGLQILDKIQVSFIKNDTIGDIVKRNASDIMSQVLATDISFDGLIENSFWKNWDINNQSVTISIHKS